MTDSEVVAVATDEGGGVMVVSAWPEAVAGVLLARITMTGAGDEPVVQAVKGPAELHRIVDEWLASLGSGGRPPTSWPIHGRSKP